MCKVTIFALLEFTSIPRGHIYMILSRNSHDRYFINISRIFENIYLEKKLDLFIDNIFEVLSYASYDATHLPVTL